MLLIIGKTWVSVYKTTQEFKSHWPLKHSLCIYHIVIARRFKLLRNSLRNFRLSQRRTVYIYCYVYYIVLLLLYIMYSIWTKDIYIIFGWTTSYKCINELFNDDHWPTMTLSITYTRYCKALYRSTLYKDLCINLDRYLKLTS